MILSKNFSYEIKDVDEPQGIVTIYVNSFDKEDSDGDISHKSSFNRTIKNEFNRIKHFRNHNPDQNIGLPKEMQADDFGLKVVSQLNMEKELARDVFSDYKLHAELNRSMEHSIGFNVMQRDAKDKKIITEYKLWEYSSLSHWGANQDTPQVDAKDLSRDDIIDQIYYISKAFEKADFTDAKFRKLEQNMVELTKAYELVKDSQTPFITTDNKDLEAIKYFKQILN